MPRTRHSCCATTLPSSRHRFAQGWLTLMRCRLTGIRPQARRPTFFATAMQNVLGPKAYRRIHLRKAATWPVRLDKESVRNAASGVGQSAALQPRGARARATVLSRIQSIARRMAAHTGGGIVHEPCRGDVFYG